MGFVLNRYTAFGGQTNWVKKLCPSCKDERMFKNNQCISCGNKLTQKLDHDVRKEQGRDPHFHYKKKGRTRLKTINDAKRAAFQQKMAASRAMFGCDENGEPIPKPGKADGR